jgi:hypothetical protein
VVGDVIDTTDKMIMQISLGTNFVLKNSVTDDKSGGRCQWRTKFADEICFLCIYSISAAQCNNIGTMYNNSELATYAILCTNVKKIAIANNVGKTDFLNFAQLLSSEGHKALQSVGS